MTGSNHATGRRLAGIAHLKQSIGDILTTPIGSRVMRRDYGSRLPELVDTPANRNGVMDLIIATAGALAKWEPRLRLTRVRVDVPTADGRMAIGVEGIYQPDGKAVALDGIIL